ncbi:nuclear transport factor 2 family protein [Mycobacterium sp. NPDC006124]|uniref:nuclear transport factor 2 family protein n=1 Tax=Mycobacterium sp. NPDC006124 TaxID=3156729 RepID=UPI0033BEEA81
MPSAELMTQNVHRYLELVGEAKVDDIAELYADDATVEDPVGGEVHIGRSAIHGFYAGMLGMKAETEIITLRALGHEAAYLWALIIDGGEAGRTRLEILSVMAFDDEGKITAMKAYWGPENFSQV